MSDAPLPKGAKPAPPGTPAIVQATDEGDFMKFSDPVMDGVRTQVQHPVSAGKPPTKLRGMISAGVIDTSDGPRVMINIGHPDGACLAAIMFADEFEAFGNACTAAAARAALIAASAGQKPS